MEIPALSPPYITKPIVLTSSLVAHLKSQVAAAAIIDQAENPKILGWNPAFNKHYKKGFYFLGK